MVEHISAADAKPPNGPEDGVAVALAEAELPEEADGDPAPSAVGLPEAGEQPDKAIAAKTAATRKRTGLFKDLAKFFKRSHSAWSSTAGNDSIQRRQWHSVPGLAV